MQINVFTYWDSSVKMSENFTDPSTLVHMRGFIYEPYGHES